MRRKEQAWGRRRKPELYLFFSVPLRWHQPVLKLQKKSQPGVYGQLSADLSARGPTLKAKKWLLPGQQTGNVSHRDLGCHSVLAKCLFRTAARMETPPPLSMPSPTAQLGGSAGPLLPGQVCTWTFRDDAGGSQLSLVPPLWGKLEGLTHCLRLGHSRAWWGSQPPTEHLTSASGSGACGCVAFHGQLHS